MMTMPDGQLIAAALQGLRQAESPPAARALAAARLSAACAGNAANEASPSARRLPDDDPATRMFGFGRSHDDALPYTGQGTRTGTITYVDDERIEQYVGAQHWVAYRQTDLGTPGFALGDQVRIGSRAGVLTIESVADNRLANRAAVPPAAQIRSGMTVFRTGEADEDELRSAAHSTAERYQARVDASGDTIALMFPSGGRLAVFASSAATIPPVLHGLVSQALIAAIRIESVIRADDAAAALECESALVYCAALLSSSSESVISDDTGAIFSAEAVYELGVRDETRASALTFAAAAARQVWPTQPEWFSGRGGVCDELTVISRRPWRADFAAAFFSRAAEALADAMQRTGDPIIPAAGTLYDAALDDDMGDVQPLLTLSYDTVRLDAGFIDVRAGVAGEGPAARLAARRDLAALLGGDAASAIVLHYGNATEDIESERFGLEMRRADTLATALAAAFTRRGDCIALDADGVLYDAADLIAAAVARRGKSASWNARVAALLAPDE